MMSKNAKRITAGLQALVHKPFEVISGSVLSVDVDAGTMKVQPAGDGEPIAQVRLTAVSGNTDGLLLIPDVDSHVVIGSIDGPGEWVLLVANKLTKATLKIGSITCEIADSKLTFKNQNTLLDISNSAFKMNTASESLFDILKDLLTYISVLTVSTPSGPSSPPVNVSDFTALISRLSNLLAH